MVSDLDTVLPLTCSVSVSIEASPPQVLVLVSKETPPVKGEVTRWVRVLPVRL